MRLLRFEYKTRNDGQVKLIGIFVLGLDILLQTVFRSMGLGMENRGVSFGMGQEWGNIISIVVFSFICIYLYRFRVNPPAGEAGPGMAKYWYLIVLGGAGNIVCRLVWGSVWDYICLPFLPFCFNLSDVLISLGVVSYILMGNGNRNSLRR